MATSCLIKPASRKGRNARNPLPPGLLLDPKDREYYGRYNYWVHSKGYVVRRYKDPNGKIWCLHICREIMGTFGNRKLVVDHINGNKLDCRRSNLRVVTVQQNSQNQGLRSNNTSGYQGVTWDKSLSKWAASAKKDYKSIHLGVYDDVHEAGRVAHEYRQKHFVAYTGRAYAPPTP